MAPKTVWWQLGQGMAPMKSLLLTVPAHSCPTSTYATRCCPTWPYFVSLYSCKQMGLDRVSPSFVTVTCCVHEESPPFATFPVAIALQRDSGFQHATACLATAFDTRSACLSFVYFAATPAARTLPVVLLTFDLPSSVIFLCSVCCTCSDSHLLHPPHDTALDALPAVSPTWTSTAIGQIIINLANHGIYLG